MHSLVWVHPSWQQQWGWGTLMARVLFTVGCQRILYLCRVPAHICFGWAGLAAGRTQLRWLSTSFHVASLERASPGLLDCSLGGSRLFESQTQGGMAFSAFTMTNTSISSKYSVGGRSQGRLRMKNKVAKPSCSRSRHQDIAVMLTRGSVWGHEF